MKRRPNTQDISWFLDENSGGRLDLDPPYQRRSVWTLKDRRYFLDTVFKNFPCPAIFLHKSQEESGKSTYHVVDGKQRLQAILSFVDNEYSLAEDLGDVNLNGKYWREISPENRKKLWDYVLPVELIGDVNIETVNEIFDRVNRNQIKLNNQELRHAKFMGWLVSEAEKEAEKAVWKNYGISTIANARRMRDVQFISELMLVVLDQEIIGFSQSKIDDKYAEYDDPNASNPDFTEDAYQKRMDSVKKLLNEIEQKNSAISKHAKNFTHFYSLWSLISLHGDSLGSIAQLSRKYDQFMTEVERVKEREGEVSASKDVIKYFDNARGASTDLKQRKARLDVLVKILTS